MTAADEPADGKSALDLVVEVTAYDEELGAAVVELEERVEELEATVDEKEDEVETLTERLQRTQADFQNYKKRAKERQEEAIEAAKGELIERFLEVRDNLSRALEDESSDLDSLEEGLRVTRNEFDRVLDAENVARIDPDPGTDVDPTRHEVMMRVESDEPDETIASVFRAGYEMGERILRTAQVTVSDGQAEDTAGSEGNPDESDAGASE